MDNANRAGRMMLSARVNPAYMARKAGFCPGAIGDTPVFLSITQQHYSWMTLAIFEWEKRMAPVRGNDFVCVAGV